jgi:acid phosphatase family membrane protein YuiD
MDLTYGLMPFIAWFVAGCTKFALSCIKERRLVFDLIGYGGMPSNHSAIVSSVVVLIALKEGIAAPALSVSLALAFVVMLDANSLRRQIGRQAEAIQLLAATQPDLIERLPRLRTRMGHSSLEILMGTLVGATSALAVYRLSAHFLVV